MRALFGYILGAILLVPAPSAVAQSAPQANRAFLPIDMGNPWHYGRHRHDGEPFPLLPGIGIVPSAALRIGPIAFETGAKARAGHYRVEGMDVLGASLSGSVDGRGARLELRWRQ